MIEVVAGTLVLDEDTPAVVRISASLARVARLRGWRAVADTPTHDLYSLLRGASAGHDFDRVADQDVSR